MSYPKFLALRDAKITTLKLETAPNGDHALRVRGFVFHSAMAVDEVRVERSGVATSIIVTLVPARRGKDGNFDVSVPLATPNATVSFGPAADPLWPVGRTGGSGG